MRETFDIVGTIDFITNKKTKVGADFINVKILENPIKNKSHLFNLFNFQKDILLKNFKLGDFIKIKGFLSQGTVNKKVSFINIEQMFKTKSKTEKTNIVNLTDDGALEICKESADKKTPPNWQNIKTFSWELCSANQKTEEQNIKEQEQIKTKEIQHDNKHIRADAWGLHIVDELRAKYSKEFSNIEANYKKKELEELLKDQRTEETVKDKEIILNNQEYSEQQKNIIYTELKKRHEIIKQVAFHFYNYHKVRRGQASEEKIKEQTSFEKIRRDHKNKEIHGQPHDFVRFLTNNLDIKNKIVMQTKIVNILYKNLGTKEKNVFIKFINDDEKLYLIKFNIKGYYYCIDNHLKEDDNLLMILTKAENRDGHDYNGLFISKLGAE